MNTEPIRDLEKLNKLKIVLKEKSYRDYVTFMIGINTGLRISDILQLKVSDVDGDYIKIIEQKTQKKTSTLINNELKEVIATYILDKKLKKKDYLFNGTWSKEPLTTRSFWRIIRHAGDSIGLTNIGTHSMRKTFGYHLYKKTKDIALLQQLFNHSSQWITLKYLGINQDEIDKVIKDFTL